MLGLRFFDHIDDDLNDYLICKSTGVVLIIAGDIGHDNRQNIEVLALINI